ncbi:MAG: PhnD/SsuA/transferrin family substrate-binding protein [Chlorogloeopsis fritschii C42_A2020_084]|uniref:phosphate/phosphite/phosphonate ABC transporter substrate-binding protein n=1 Tax=Chlorogloeopsis fritschii TaxID=1124 RepID=UPI001A045F30|nr:PhnD/SsuA/transferrin family substrate-binding protein [Chlorogloeopsis fritschii]MBF2005579.1 PhnD/SsuA/transferrin family substrate-binding protein [Chlorogloeopsis fritschii C42_A2020_084]
MKIIVLPRLFFLPLLVLIGLLGVGCNSKPTNNIPNRLTIGVVSYGEGKVSLDKYERFKDYIGSQTRSIIELEPAYNELQAVAQIQRKRWDIVFATPGLAAIAIGKELYIPLFSMEGVSSRQRSLLIVRDDQPIKKISDLANKTVALGETGSAAGYYVPLYDLYGLTLAQIRSAPTPVTVLEWISDGSVDAGAISEQDFELYRRKFATTKFRILHTSRWIPPGVVLLAPTIERNQQQQIQKAMNDAPADLAADAGYVPAAKIPNYTEFIKLIEKVKPLEGRVRQTPAILLPETPEQSK